MRKNQQKSKNKDQKEKNGRKKKRKLHTQVYTVEMGKCTKINKRVKNKLQREKKWTNEQYPCYKGATRRENLESMVRRGATGTGSAFRIRRKLWPQPHSVHLTRLLLHVQQPPVTTTVSKSASDSLVKLYLYVCKEISQEGFFSFVLNWNEKKETWKTPREVSS